ncbi:hypothetical protein pb186bvf_007667 [Paramecium bursaria]
MLELLETFQPDQNTFQLAQDLVHRYGERHPSVPKLALWLASKQQQITAIDGSVIQGAGIELNHIINDYKGNLDELFDIGISMVQELKIDHNCYKMIANYKNTVQNLMMFYKKLDTCINTIEMKNIAWLLFIAIKKHLKLFDVVSCTCALASIINLVLLQVIPVTVMKQYQEIKKSDNMQQELLNYLLQFFKIRDYEMFALIDQQVQQSYQDLIKYNVIKSLKAQHGMTIFAGSIINSNQYKLDVHYKTLIKDEEFDERLILPDRHKNMTPKKVTPKLNSIKQAAQISKNEGHREQQTNRYQKLLNYEMDSRITINTNLKEIKLPQNVLMSPYAQQQIVATPMSEAMEMYNWLNDKQTPFKKYLKQGQISLVQFCQQDQSLSNISQLSQQQQQLIDKFFNSMISFCEESNIIEQNKQKRQLYWTLYVLIIEKQNYHIDEIYLRSLLVTVVEIVNYVLTKSQSMIEQLIQKCQASNFIVWQQLDFILNQFDPKIPFQLKEHFLDIETKFVSFNIWACDSQSDLISFLNEINIKQQQSDTMNRLFKRVLHYCAYQIQTLGASLRVSEQTQEHIWITVKFIICERPEQLRNHSLDQIVLASIYAVLKITGTQIKFQTIINAYEQTNTWYSKAFIKKMVCNVYINYDTMGDIVQYYNQIFIPQVKQFLVKMTQEIKLTNIPQSPLINKNPALNNKILASPLRDVLPRVLMTPSTQLLYAYQESPLLKQPVKDKENINNLNNLQTLNNSSRIDYSQETQDFIMKKFEQIKTSKAKIVNQKPSFSILASGSTKPQIKTSRNNSFAHQNQNISAHSHTENSTFQKLLNFEQ